jgi:hypothetical protein
MHEAHDLPVVLGDDQAAGVEVRLGENAQFQQRGRAQTVRPAIHERLVPYLNDGGRIRIAKMTE